MFLDKDVAKFVENVEKSTAKPLYELTPQEAREVLLSAQENKEENTDIEVSKISAPLGGGRTMPVQIIKPLKAPDTLPIIYYIHGGGWVMGNEKTHARLTRELSLKTNAAVVFPIYENSPEAQYPQTTTDLFTVLQYIAEHAASYGLDTERLAVAGDSVGGNMALVMAMMVKENKGPKIIFQLLLYPVAGANFETDSYKTFANGPWLTKKAMQWFWKQYAPNENNWQENSASPINATPDELSALPPALIITDENDVLRDEGETLAQKLNEAGTPSASVRINGTIHDFLMLNALADSAPSKATFWLISGALKSYFEDRAD